MDSEQEIPANRGRVSAQEFLGRLMEIAFSAEPPIEIVIRKDAESVPTRHFTVVFADLAEESNALRVQGG